MPSKLTAKQQAFIRHPLAAVEPIQAAREVGYAESVAHRTGNEMSRKFAEEIREWQDKIAEKFAISTNRIQQELAAMGFANVIDYFHTMDDGTMRPKAMHELTRAQTAAIQEFSLMEHAEIDMESGEERKIMVIERLKLADKRQNLVELGKTLGMFNKLHIDVHDKRRAALDDIPTDALEQAERLLLTAARQARSESADANALPGEYAEVTAQKSTIE